MILDIKTVPDPVLRVPTIEVTHLQMTDGTIAKLVGDMFETMNYSNGIGLSAPQVGQSLRLFIVRWTGRQLICINPSVEQAGRWGADFESCLSIPDKRVRVPRPSRIWLHWTDFKGDHITKKFTHMMARVIMHEFDHIGIELGSTPKLITDYA